jgi:hypothetical protein
MLKVYISNSNLLTAKFAVKLSVKVQICIGMKDYMMANPSNMNAAIVKSNSNSRLT